MGGRSSSALTAQAEALVQGAAGREDFLGKERRVLGWWRRKEQAEVPGGEHPTACVEGVTGMGLRGKGAPRVKLGTARGEGLAMAS